MDLKPYSLSHGAHKMRKDPDTDISSTFQRKRILQPLGSGFGAIPGFQSRNALDIFAYLLLRLENRWALHPQLPISGLQDPSCHQDDT